MTIKSFSDLISLNLRFQEEPSQFALSLYTTNELNHNDKEPAVFLYFFNESTRFVNYVKIQTNDKSIDWSEDIHLFEDFFVNFCDPHEDPETSLQKILKALFVVAFEMMDRNDHSDFEEVCGYISRLVDEVLGHRPNMNCVVRRIDAEGEDTIMYLEGLWVPPQTSVN